MVMKDLRDAIKKVIEDGYWGHEDIGYGGSKQVYMISTSDIYNLVAEYNIHFVEPEEEQLTI